MVEGIRGGLGIGGRACRAADPGGHGSGGRGRDRSVVGPGNDRRGSNQGRPCPSQRRSTGAGRRGLRRAAARTRRHRGAERRPVAGKEAPA